MFVTVIMGGDSSEREISLRTGATIAKALSSIGHCTDKLELDRIADITTQDFSQTDLIFPALHGGHGEDGHLQSLLDVLGIPYTLSGPLASALAMNKAAAKRIMTSAQIPTPDWLLITYNTATGAPIAVQTKDAGKEPGAPANLTLDHIQHRAATELGYPLVAKLNDGGSSVGVAIVEKPADFPEAFAKVAAAATGHRTEILLETFIPGRELTAAILLGRRLPLLEIRPTEGFYDYDHKYTKGASEYLCPAPVDSPFYENMCADALKLYDLLGCQGTARIDFRFDGARHYCLEANTIPGMTELSLVPMAAAAVGISFEALVDDLCRDALLRRGLPVPD